MPKRSSYKKKRRKRRGGLIPYPQLRTKFLTSSASIMPDVFRTSLRYCTTIELDPAAGNIGNHVFRANGIYDPDVTGVGHQPLGHDEFLPLYDEYTVIVSKISARFISDSADVQTGSCNVGITLSEQATLNNTLETVREHRNTSYGYMGIRNQGAGVQTISKRCDVAKYMGLKDVTDDSSLRAEMTSDPGKVLYFHVWCEPYGLLTDLNAIPVYVQIDYDIIMSGPKQLIQS